MRLWHPVTRRDPCPVCDRPDWCAVSSDGRVARCMRVVDGPDVVASEDSNGTPYGLRFLTDGPCDPSAYRKHDPEPERASPEILHRVYSALLHALPLSPAHRASLRDRGLADDAIDTRCYRSLPLGDQPRRKIMRELRAALDGTIPDGVPGIFKGKLAGFSGILIPVRTHTGMVRAIKVRADDPHAPKYTWISSASDDGPSPGAPCHVPFFSGSTATVRVTEGPLKADLATSLSNTLTLGIPGCSSAQSAVEHLRALKVIAVRLAWDMDARTNPSVADGLRRAVDLFREEGFSVAVETWDESAGKGIDDALRAGLRPGAGITVHTGEDVDRVLDGMARREPPKTSAGPSAPSSTPSPAVDIAAERRARGARSFDRGDSVELAAAIVSDLRAEAPDAGDLGAIYDRGTFWVYSPAAGIYEERDLSSMLRLCASYAGTPTGPKGKPLSLSDGAIKGAVKVASWHLARPGYFDAAPRGMVFANAFVTARDGQVVTLDHSPAHRAIHALPVPYEPGRPPSRWLAMLREIFRRVIDREENEPEEEVARLDREDTDACIDLLQEWTGTTLLGGATARAICMILVGNGNDGKSSILSVLRALFPPSSVCSIAVQDWSRGFLLAGLAGKRLNVVSELPERELIDGDRFKAVVAGDPLTAERKNQDPFDLVCEAGHVFACNALPATRDQSRGFWRRFVVIPCERSFTEAEAVRDLWREIIAEELAAIAAWAIEGAARAQLLKSFTAPESAAKAKADWQHESDQVRQWAEECCAVLPPSTPSAEESTIADLYGIYRAWCGATGHAPMVRNKLASRLKGLGHEHRTKHARLYRLRIVAAWQGKGAQGLTQGKEGGYRAPLN